MTSFATSLLGVLGKEKLSIFCRSHRQIKLVKRNLSQLNCKCWQYPASNLHGMHPGHSTLWTWPVIKLFYILLTLSQCLSQLSVKFNKGSVSKKVIQALATISNSFKSHKHTFKHDASSQRYNQAIKRTTTVLT